MISILKLKIRFIHKYTADELAALSIGIFIILYYLPITILIPELIRKPLLILGFVFFTFSILLKGISYFLGYIITIVFLVLYYLSSWKEWVSFTSYIFPMLISLESLFLAAAVVDKKIVISDSVVFFLITIVGITALTTSLGLLTFPMAVRELGQLSTDETLPTLMLYRKYNIAGWGLLFGMAFLEGPLLYLYKVKRKKYLLAISILNAICVLLSQLAFAIIISFIESFFVFINVKNKKVLYSIFFFVFVFGILLWLIREPILMYIYNFLGDYNNLAKLQLRVKNVYDLLVLNSTEGDAGARFSLYMKSFDTFLKHPFGLLIDGESAETLLGFHSEFFDFLGAMGIIGAVFVTIMIFRFLTNVKKTRNGYDKRFLGIMEITFMLFFVINPVFTHPHIWISTLLIPAVIINSNDRNLQ